MAYNSQIPQATDQMSVSQGQILPNFQEIAIAFNANHVNFNTGSVEGMHDFVQFPTGAPSLTTKTPITGQVALYSNTYNDIPELFFQRANLGAGAGIPITSMGSSSGVNWAYLPSGQVLKWGTATTNGVGKAIINLSPGAPVPTYAVATTLALAMTGGVGTLPSASANYSITLLQNGSPSTITLYTWTPAISGGGNPYPNAAFSWYTIGI